MTVPCVLGIDQGSSHTWAVAASLDGPEAGRLLALGRGPGACHPYDGMDAAMAAVAEAVTAALAGAGVDPASVRQVCAGLTGADWPDEYELLRTQIGALGFGRAGGERLVCPIRVTNDCIVALRGGTEQPYGAILVLGSGGNCAVRSPAGEEFIYGYYHDDALQGGHGLGVAALWAAYRDHTGRPPATSLTARLLDFYGLKEMDQVRRLHAERRLPVPPKDLAPIVLQEAGRGDPAAVDIVTAFGRGCAELVVAALRRFDMLALPLDLVLSGGIFKTSEPLLHTTVARVIGRDAPNARLVNARYEPVVGAALLALEGAGLPADEPVRRRIASSARELGLVRGG